MPADVDVEQLYTRYGPMVLRRCRALLRNEQEAVDAMQDVFVQLLRNRDRLAIAQDNSGASLLYRIATNVCLNRLRTRRRRPEDPESELLQRIASCSTDHGRLEARSLLDRLLSTNQESISSGTIAVLHLHDGMTLEEVATAVGMSVSGVRKRLQKLQDSLKQLEGEP